MFEWWDQFPWGSLGFVEAPAAEVREQRGAGHGAGGGSSEKRAGKQRGEAETQSPDSALDWGREVIHNPLEEAFPRSHCLSPGTSRACAFHGRASLNYSRSWGWDLIPENAPGAKEKTIPQLAASP